jgi:hypothetical protein
VELLEGLIPSWIESEASKKRGLLALGCEYYIKLRNLILAIFYWTPTTFLSFDRCFQYIRVSEPMK